MKLLICTQAMDKNHPVLGFFHRWVEEFAKHCEVVHVICLIEGEHALPANVHVYSLGKETGASRLTYLWRFYAIFGKLFFTGKIDYVFYHMGAVYNIVGAPFYILRKFKGVKFYWWKAHGHTTLTEKLALAFCERVYTASHLSFPVATKKKVVIGHAIDVPQSLIGDKEPNSLIVVGRISPVKKIEVAIDVVSGLSKTGVDVTLSIVGASVDAPYANFLENHTKTLHLTDRVTFRGGVTHAHIPMLIQKAQVLLHTSKTDSIDKVVLEAMASGTIPVSTCIAFKEMLEPYGLFATEQNLMNKVIEVLHMPAHEYQLLAEKLHREVVKKHSLETLVARLFVPSTGRSKMATF